MSTDEPRVDRSGIHIDRELAESVAIEEDLDANLVGAYRFPSPERRRIAGGVYVVMALLALLVIDGGWVVALGLAGIGLWHFLAAWPLRLNESEALRIAGKAIDFPVGHASASVRFTGWRSRPRWAVVLYSGVEPPDERGLVVVDAVDGRVIETYQERISPV